MAHADSTPQGASSRPGRGTASPGRHTTATVGGCGAVAIDHVLFLERGLDHGKAKVLREELVHGGNIATALCAVTALGGAGRWVGYLPDGSAREDLLERGLDLSLATPTATSPIQSTILVDPAGSRFIAYSDDTLLGADPSGSDDVLDGLDVLLLDAYAGTSAGLALLDAAHHRGIATVADVEHLQTSDARSLMDRVQHLVVSFEFARTAVAADSPEAAVAALWNADRNAVVVTDGDRGAWFRTRDESGHVPAFQVPVVDTNGCGDVFHGVYALRIAEGRTVEDAVIHAAAGAAVAATAAGGRGHLPTQDDLAALLATRASRTARDLTT